MRAYMFSSSVKWVSPCRKLDELKGIVHSDLEIMGGIPVFDKSCSQSYTTLFTIAHSGSEGRHKPQCGGDERTLYGKSLEKGEKNLAGFWDKHLLITKGEAEGILGICQRVSIDGSPQSFNEDRRAAAEETFKRLSADGYRTLGVAVLKVDKRDVYTPADERDMTLAGLAVQSDACSGPW
jgi:magnesium-transporting ATPase (P-type)